MGKRRTLEKINQAIRVLITGGFGYVGGRVAQHLAKNGYQVVLGSRKKQNRPSWLPQSEVVQIIWNDEDRLRELCSRVSIVIHTAGMNVQDCSSDPVAAFEFNGLATARLVRASKNSGVKKFIYLSTAHVYSSPLVGSIDEHTCPRNIHPYATSHFAGERAILYSSGSNFTGIILRLSNVIGAPVHNNVNCWMLVVNDLCRQVVQSNRMKINSSGLQRRDFISISEVNRRINDFISGKELVSESLVANIGSGISISIKDIANMIAERYQLMSGQLASLEFLQDTHIDTDVELEYKSLTKNESNKNDVILDIKKSIDEVLHFCGEVGKDV
ncbi:MAG: SDR family oxidoreductase [Gammaproteobacteria bacterium]|nr:SDR family oxidoreductase [Gammaproteobacteria bacterium]